MNLSGIIMAGGKSSRMGVDKTHLKLREESFLSHAIKLLEHFTDDIIISSNQSLSTKYKVVPDKIQNIGPIGGLQTCLPLIKSDKAIVIPVDMPLMTPQIIKYLYEQADLNLLLNLLEIEGQPQMLTAIYDKKILAYIDELITKKNYRLRSFLSLFKVGVIPADHYKNELININRPIDLKKIRKNEK